MTCPRCKTAMEELKRSYHKKRKWICRQCGKIRFQQIGGGNKGAKRPKE